MILKKREAVPMKKFILILLIISVFFSIPVYAAEESADLKAKADTLSILGILKGDGNSYNLSGSLKKCEAATFITRLIGKTDLIENNPDQYRNTIFSDVPPNQWYAPYVGYCYQNGIITGYNGLFEPQTEISEKSFLSAVIRAMGYVYGSDFTWTDVYQTAYNIGLVTDESYIARVDDNVNYTRGDVISVLYNALKLKKKDSDTTMIEDLINSNIVSRETVIASGFPFDVLPAEILEVKAVNEKNVTVLFNEDIKSIPSAGIQIYDASNSSNKLTVKVTSITGKQAVLETSEQVADKDYILDISYVEDKTGNISGRLTASFTGFRNPVLASDFFRISKVEVVNSRVINLYFTHPLISSSEIPTYYELFENGYSFVTGSSQSLTVRRLNSSDTGVTIFLKEKALNEGMNYELKVNGSLTSLYGVRLNEEAGDSIKFTGSGKEYDDLKVVNVYALSSNKVAVEFNSEVDPVFAQKFLNYTIIAPDNSQIAVNKAVVGGDGDKYGKVVTLNLLSALDKSKQYTLRLEYIPDIFRLSALEESTYTFLGTYPDKPELKLDFALALDKGTVWVAFKQPMDPTVASVNSLYLITGVTNPGFYAVPVKVQYIENGTQYIAKLYLPSDKLLSGSNKYTVSVMSTIQDRNGNNFSRNAEATFNGTDTDIQKIGISDAVIISKDTIKLVFNKEVANDIMNIQPSNYTLESNESGVTVTRNPMFVSLIDNNTMILKFDSLDYSSKYTLRYNTLKDITGASITPNSTENFIEVRMGK